MKIERQYYPLADAAKRLCCTEEELIHLAAIDELHIWSMLDRVASVNSLPKSNGFADFSADWIHGENGEYVSTDFVKLENSYFRQVEAGVAEPQIVAFEVDGTDGEIFFFGATQKQPQVRHFLKRDEVERLDVGSASATCNKQSKMTSSRAHVSDKLAKMNQAAAKFWGNADRADRGTHPDNATVAAWLVKQDFSSTLAGKAATIIRPEWAPTGRKPEE